MSRFRSSVRNLASALSLEGEDTPIVEDVESDAALVESSSEVDAELDDTETALDTSETLAEDAETVENVGGIVEDSIESGEGLDETAAAVVQETIEGIMRRHGMPRRAWPKFPGLENYNSRSNRIKASKQLLVSLEGVWDSIKKGITKVWETIRDFFVGLWKKLTDFEYRLFNKFKDLKKKAEELKASDSKDGFELGSVSGYITESKEVDIKDIISDFTEFGKNLLNIKPHIERAKRFLDPDEAALTMGNLGELSKKDQKEEVTQAAAAANINPELAEARLYSAFSNVNRDEHSPLKEMESKAEKIKGNVNGKDLVSGCNLAIEILGRKPMALMSKVSDGFIMHVLKTIAAWFSGDDKDDKAYGSRSTAEVMRNGEKDDDGKSPKVTGKEVFQKTASAYKYIMYNNIKVYKDTISNYYDIIDDLVSEIGYEDSSNKDED